jgi:glycosyltransferase involved in cell wall biosynthesis
MTRDGAPRFSVVVPTYSRPRQLGACLTALAASSYPRELFEVVVVNDGGAPPDECVASFRDRLDVRLISQEHAGPAIARNTGAANAAGTFLAFTDDDCMPAPGWLRALDARLAAEPDRLVGGRIVNSLSENVYSEASQLLVQYLYEYFADRRSGPRFFSSSNLALRADLFQAIGGFDRGFVLSAGEDREICDRWQQGGRELSYEADALVYHAHDLSLKRFVRQHFAYGRGAHFYHLARSERKQERMKVEPLRFYTGMMRYPFRSATGARALGVAALLVVSQAANAAGFFYERKRG